MYTFIGARALKVDHGAKSPDEAPFSERFQRSGPSASKASGLISQKRSLKRLQTDTSSHWFYSIDYRLHNEWRSLKRLQTGLIFIKREIGATTYNILTKVRCLIQQRLELRSIFAKQFEATLRMPLDKPATSEKWPSGPFINSSHCVEFGHPADRLIQPSLGLRSISVKRFEATLRMPLDELAASEKWPSGPFINSPHCGQFRHPADRLI
jgi:hypothetical protein